MCNGSGCVMIMCPGHTIGEVFPRMTSEMAERLGQAHHERQNLIQSSTNALVEPDSKKWDHEPRAGASRSFSWFCHHRNDPENLPRFNYGLTVQVLKCHICSHTQCPTCPCFPVCSICNIFTGPKNGREWRSVFD